MTEHPEGKIIEKLTSQKDTLKMARYFAEQNEKHLTVPELFFASLGTVIFYGVGIGFLIYIIFNFH